MDIVESLLTRADWHAEHHVSGPSYCYTVGDQNVDRKAADEIERLRLAFHTAHGALLCIGGTDSNWSEYARNVANEAGSIVLNVEQFQDRKK